jgi:hypothetical protein
MICPSRLHVPQVRVPVGLAVALEFIPVPPRVSMASVIDDDGATNDVSVVHTIETVVDGVEFDLLDRVLDLAALRQRHDLAEVAEISPERPVIRIFPGDKRKQRNVDLLRQDPKLI